MGISDRIEAFITELLKEDENDWIELRRNELAAIFNCVPSQINYVISTRFNANHGYVVESRRGGGGYLKIRKLDTGDDNPIFSVLKSIPLSLDYPSAKKHIIYLSNQNAIDTKTANVILSTVSDTSLTISQPQKDILRANILKNALSTLI